jgi:hypothetical protein
MEGNVDEKKIYTDDEVKEMASNILWFRRKMWAENTMSGKIYTAISKAWKWIARSPKLIAGAALIVTGVCFGCYVGFYWCLVGGIVDIFTAFKGESVATSMLAYGLLKCFFAGLSGWGCAALFVIPGLAIISSDKK